MTAACPVPRANSRAASKRRASNAATSRRPWRVLAMPQHGIVPDDDHQSISRESLVAVDRGESEWTVKCEFSPAQGATAVAAAWSGFQQRARALIWLRLPTNHHLRGPQRLAGSPKCPK